MYETPDFVKADPVQIPARYYYNSDQRNLEISAFITAWIAWGSRKQIIEKADFIDREIFKGEPAKYILSEDWRQFLNSSENLYRTFNYGDFFAICQRLWSVYQAKETLEQYLAETKGVVANSTVLYIIQLTFGEINGIPNEKSQSACKRLNMFLRWMCRQKSPVDFGIWTICPQNKLIIPLDTHVHKQALRLGLTSRRTPDLQTAIEITDQFNELFPGDPTKGDFALFGYGVNNSIKQAGQKVKQAVEKLGVAATKATKAIREITEKIKPVEEMTITDVLQLPLFFDNAQKDLADVWNQRVAARKTLKPGERLRAHPIDDLHAAGLWEPGEFIVVYAKVLEKAETGLSSVKRNYILGFGNGIFNKTVQTLLDNEKAGNNSDGDDKQ